MAPVVAVAAKVFTAVAAKVTFAAVAKFVVTTALSIGVSKLLAKRAMKKADAGGFGGGRVQLPPATDNKIPVIYGSAFVGGPITDAMISADQKTMWYVVALAEVTDTSAGSAITFGDIYYDGKLVQFGSQGAVTALINNSTTPSQTDTRVNGFLSIYLYTNGSNSPYTPNTTLTASQVLSVANGVPASQAWGANHAMTNCAFAIVQVKYSTDAGTTSLGAITAQVINTEGSQSAGTFRPGSAIRDYMVNTRYGCSIPLSQVDTVSLDNLNTYSDQLIDVTGGPSATQSRYRINGPLDTSSNCLDNLQFLVDSCDSWLQYSELSGRWKVVMNKAFDQSPDSVTVNDLFIVNSSNLVGGIEISPIDLNETYNQVEVAYPNFNIKDQTDYQIIDLFTTNPNLLSQNEAVNRLNVTLPLVNNAVQAKYLAARRIYQSREDLVISFRTDYSGIQVDAGDVIRVYHETYGWDADNGFPDGKLFRVSEVIEEKDSEGNLFATMRAFEYNATIYVDDPVQDYVPAFNTGLSDPNIISEVAAPTAVDFTPNEGLVTGILLAGVVPEQGSILYMDFNFGLTSNVQEHVRYKRINQSNGTPFINSDYGANNLTTVFCEINDLIADDYYFSVTARNDFVGRTSNASNVFNWEGANIQPFDPNSNTGGISGNQIQSNTITIINFQSGLDITQRISGNNFSIREGNPQANLAPVLLPVSATANATRNVPIYFIGNSVDANNLYPYYQGTSQATTGNNGNNYYSVSSTGAWTPAGAGLLAAGDGEDRWYAVVKDDFPAGSLVNNQAYFMNVGFTAVSDTDGSLLQVVQGYKIGNNNFYFSDTNRMDSIEILVANTSYSWTRTQVQILSEAGNITGGAVLVRNLTPNANVIITSGSFQSLKGQPPFF